MSSLAWSRSPLFDATQRTGRRPIQSSVPSGFKIFLQNKIRPVPMHDELERDHVIRRAVALWRLCWRDVPDGWELLDERMRATLGEGWLEAFEKRNDESVLLA